MNIYQKICPECAAANSLTAPSCGCGHCFDPEASGNTDPTEYALQQDLLYRDYLAARIAQAEAELVVARERANADPGNAHNASRALLAEQALHALQAEIKQLDLKIPPRAPARVKTIVGQPMKLAPTTPPPAAPRPRVAVAPNITPKIASKVFAPTKAPAPRVEPPVRHRAPPPSVVVQSKPKLTRRARSPMNGVKAALGLARKLIAASPAKTRPRVSSRPAVLAPAAAPVNGQRQPAKPSVRTQPDEGFRRIQAQKAEAIARSNRPAAAPQPMPSGERPTPQQATADLPPLLLGTQNPTEECPNCTATVAANAPRCSCGYALTHPGEEVPAITLDATALAILTEGISFTSSNRRR